LSLALPPRNRPADSAIPAAGPSALPAAKAENEKPFASPRAASWPVRRMSISPLCPHRLRRLACGRTGCAVLPGPGARVTPVAQRMAAQVGVDLRAISGTGPRGRIVKDDIARASQSAIQAPQSSIINQQSEILERIPLKGVRAIIAERMAASVHTTARVTLVTEADATEFVAARVRIKEKVEKDWGFAPGYNDLLAIIVTTALRRFPYMNARLAPDAIEILGHIHMAWLWIPNAGYSCRSSETPAREPAPVRQ